MVKTLDRIFNCCIFAECLIINKTITAMKNITLTEEELNKVLTAMKKHREVSYRHDEFLSVQKTKGDYILQISTKDGELYLLHITTFDKEQVLFNILDEDGKLLFDEGVIFALISGKDVKAGTKTGEIITIEKANK